MQEEIIHWIQQTVKNAGFKSVIVALSGGIDSALSATLAVKALGKEHVYVTMLPYGELNQQGVEHATEVADWLEIPQNNRFTINIKETVDTFRVPSEFHLNIRRGNIMARVRMIYLFDLAKKLGVLVCGTENKTEHYLGYFTRFGDSASDLEPIVGLYKTQVREMAKKLGIPHSIIEKAPSAGLWENQTDEGEFGFTYEQADKVLQLYIDEHRLEGEIIAQGIPQQTVKAVLKRMKDNEFKNKLPYTPFT